MDRDLEPVDPCEVDTIASELARAHKFMAAFYRDKMEMTGPEANARTRGTDMTPEEATEDTQRIRERPPDQIGWYDLTRLAERDPEAMAEVWRDVKDAVRRELASGHRTATALEWEGGPWERARFLAIRESFRGETPPASGIEAALIDSAAKAFSDYLEHLEHLHRMVSVDMKYEEERSHRDRKWQPQRLSYAEAIDREARRHDGAHARFLRTVKTLHEIRHITANIYVSQAGQINVGHQQVNVAPSPEDDRTRGTGQNRTK